MNSQERLGLIWKLRELAVDCRTTQTALLKEAGVSPATVSRWRHGSVPRVDTIARINLAAEAIKARAR